MNIAQIEHAAFRACPVADQQELTGIILRSNGGYTKRANSANLLANLDTDQDDVIGACETFFKQREQRSIFRLISGYQPEGMDSSLEAKGYELVDPTYVLLQPLGAAEGEQARIMSLPADEWIEQFYRISDEDDGQRTAHLHMLKKIETDCCLAVIQDSTGAVVSMGVGVVDDGYFGIFNIVTSLSAQRKGYSFALISDLLRWARQLNAHTAYVQVKQENEGALSLYKKLGYSEGYNYWYRVGGSDV